MASPVSSPKRFARLRREWDELLEHGVGIANTAGAVAALLGAALTLVIALLNWGNAFVLALIAIALQFAAAMLFARGRQQPKSFEPEKYAGRALAHLTSLARQAGDAVDNTQTIIEQADPNPDVVLERLRRANVEFSYMREWAIDAADDWLRVIEEPLERPPTGQGQSQTGTNA